MLSVFLAWWRRQLLDVLPASWRRGQSVDGLDDGLLLRWTGDGARPALDASRRRRGRELPLGQFPLEEAGLRRLRAAAGRDAVQLLLPPRLVLEQQVTLPLAAERGLETALRWEMDRLTPFSADAVFWSWTVEGRDCERNRISLRLRLVPKAAVAAVLDLLAGARLMPKRLACAEAPARAVPLGRPGRAWPLASAALAGVAACLLLAAGIVPFARQELALHALEAEIAALRPAVDAAEGLRKRLADRAASTDVVAAEEARVGDALSILATLTELLPDDTFLQALSLRDRTLTVSGQSVAAARLISAFAADPGLRNPAFAAPITRNEMTGAETFSIRVETRP